MLIFKRGLKDIIFKVKIVIIVLYFAVKSFLDNCNFAIVKNLDPNLNYRFLFLNKFSLYKIKFNTIKGNF